MKIEGFAKFSRNALVVTSMSFAAYAVGRPLFGGTALLRYPATVNLGTVVYGKVPTASVLLINPTFHHVVVRVSPACGCTTARLGREALGPFGATIMRVGFETALAPIGSSYKPISITVESEAGDQRESLPIYCTTEDLTLGQRSDTSREEKT